MKVALVHDHLTQEGGAEKVLNVFQEIFPGAPTYTLVYDADKVNGMFRGKDIRTSFLQKMPGGVKKYQWYLPFMPLATEKYDLSEYDVVLSSCSAFAKGAITLPRTAHVCYCHTPTRYLWSDTHSYVQELHYPWLIKKTIPLVLSRLRQWDRLAAERVDFFIANSNTVKERISKYYQSPSDIIYPPVETGKFRISEPGNFFLAGGRLVAYKRFDLVIQAFNQLGLPLKIFGSGPQMDDLRKMAKKNIRFLGRVSEDKKARLYSRCLAYIHPQEEDFGITAVEAMAAGRPVIAYGAGGAKETVVEGSTGQFIEEQDWAELADTIVRFEHRRYDPETIREHALKFDVSVFKDKIAGYVKKAYNDKKYAADKIIL